MPETNFKDIKNALNDIKNIQNEQNQKLDKISNWAMGTELQNGAEERIQRNKQNITKLWVTVYGILVGIIGVIYFVIRYGDKLIKTLS